MPVLTQYDSDSKDFELKFSKNEKKAMRQAMRLALKLKRKGKRK